MGQAPGNNNRDKDRKRNDPQQAPTGGGFRPRAMIIWLVIAMGVIALVQWMNNADNQQTQLKYSEFIERLEAGQIRRVIVEDQTATVEYYETRIPRDKAVQTQLQFPHVHFSEVMKFIDEYNKTAEEKGLEEVEEYDYKPVHWFMKAMSTWGVWIIMLALLWFVLTRAMRSPGAGGVLAFGKSRARMVKRQTGITFDDVAGVEEAKDEVQEIVEFLKNPAKFERLGGRVPRGVLLVGPPGTGKTLLAKAIAGEAERPFFSISGSDFVEMFVGVGASRVRDLFRQAKENAPCIIFLDEIDAVGRRRGTGLGGGHDEREQTLNAILVEMDGFDSDDRVILIAATNRPDVLDPALLRPGRFDRQIVVDPPDIKGREQILKVHAQKVRMAPHVDMHKIARGTSSFSGADLANLINESAIIAVMKGKEYVETEDLEEARDKVRWGREKKSKAMSDEERKTVAIHESGHAIIGKLLEPDVDPIHKVGIIPRGMSLGATMYLPKEDSYLMRRKKLLGNITVALGGRVAEELLTGDVTSGAQNDLEVASKIARMMVCKWGMTEELGPMDYSEGEETLFLGREIQRSHSISEETARKIDAAMRRIVDDCYKRAKELLQQHVDHLHVLQKALLEYEVLDGHEVELILEGKPLERPPLKAQKEQETPAGQEEPAEDKPAEEDPMPGLQEGIQPA